MFKSFPIFQYIDIDVNNRRSLFECYMVDLMENFMQLFANLHIFNRQTPNTIEKLKNWLKSRFLFTYFPYNIHLNKFIVGYAY